MSALPAIVRIDGTVSLRPAGVRRFILAEPITVLLMHDITDRDAQAVYTVPAGFETDLGSIPRLFRPLLSVASAPVPFLVHDFLYSTSVAAVDRRTADWIMLRLMAYLRTPRHGWQRRLAYWAVRAWGWRFFQERKGPRR